MDMYILVMVMVLVPVQAVLEYFMSVPNVVRRKGYPIEVHSVVSPDDYVLNLHRIPTPSFSSDNSHEKRPVILLHHGVASSSSSWIIGSTKRALAFLLADSGFDVWMNNARGNLYSQRHVNMTNYNPAYWNFTWEEMALKDLPVTLHYILNVTGQDQLSYVGHSMGTSVFFAAMASMPELNSKIKVMVALAPAANLSHTIAPVFKAIAPVVRTIEMIANTMGIYGLPYNTMVSSILSTFCALARHTCRNVLSQFFGPNIPEWNSDIYQEVFSTHPAGFSVRTIIHFLQLINSAQFQRYDFGPEENRKHYGQTFPPVFDPTKITAPVALFWAHNDWLTNSEDVKNLQMQLPNLVGSYKVNSLNFNHADFVWAQNVVPLLYQDVIAMLKNYV